jgi:hypothetical protein
MMTFSRNANKSQKTTIQCSIAGTKGADEEVCA